MIRIITFVTLVAYASTQSFAISTNCSNTLANIVRDQDAATCLSASSLIVAIGGSSSSSLNSTINTWLTNLCAAPACNNNTIAAVVQNVTTGCAEDLASAGFSSSSTSDLTEIAKQYYPTLRNVACLKDGNTNCITQTLNNIQTTYGSLNFSTVTSTMSGTSLADLPANITCTNCIKAIYNSINASIPSLTADAVPALQSKCGASFADGQAPSGIVESATTATSVPSNSAAWSLLSHGVFTGLSLSGAVVISTFFTLLA